MANIDEVLQRIDANQSAALDLLFELLKIPSVSTDPAFKAECTRAAQWLVDDLNRIGFNASLRTTPGHPMVVAHARARRPDAPHVLFYGHYDVQPADPLDLWETEPFAPRIVDTPTGRQIVARGASDDKGQLMLFVEACRAYMQTGGLPCHVTLLFEGEEECGSSSLPEFLAQNKKELTADIALVCDTNMWDRRTPAITTMLRGLVYEEVIVRAATRDLHSGMFGGPAANPIRILGGVIAGLHDAEGRVTLPGFYDGVDELPEDVARQWRELPFDGGNFLNEVGLSLPVGEVDRSVLEQIWARPTCEPNGIIGGYTGEGAKTVLPAEARAKISFRLVGHQDPDAIVKAFHAYVRGAIPADCRVEFLSHGASPAIVLPFTSEALTRARRALHQEWEREPALVGSGGSIPIVGQFKSELGLDALMVGFALEDDRIHSPNEKYELSSFHKGARSWARILNALAL